MDSVVTDSPDLDVPSTRGPLIAALGLNHGFGTGEARKQALFDIDLRVPRGSFTVLMGPSGSGKSTLLVTHDPRILDRADPILTLQDGRILSDRPGRAATSGIAAAP